MGYHGNMKKEQKPTVRPLTFYVSAAMDESLRKLAKLERRSLTQQVQVLLEAGHRSLYGSPFPQ